MNFFHYLFSVCAFTLAAVSLYIPPGPLDHHSRELARPSKPSTPADRAGQTTSGSLDFVEPRVPKHAMLAKRTADEESPNSPEAVQQVANARKGPVIYTSEQLATYREDFNAAQRELVRLGKKVKRARGAGQEVSQDDVDELSRLTKLTSQRKLVLSRARQGKPLDRRTSLARQDVASFMQDPKIEELTKSGVYTAQQLAAYKRNFYDAKAALAQAVKVRRITEAEKADLAELQRAFNLHRRIWSRVQQGKPADYRVNGPKKSMDRLLASAKLHEVAQSSGYSVQELAEARRRYLDANIEAKSFQNKLAEVEKFRKVTPEEKTQLRTLLQAVTQRKRVSDRMSRGQSADGVTHPPRKDLTALLQDPEIHRIAQLGDYRVEEVAVQRRAYLDAISEYRAARRLTAAVQQAGGILTPHEEDRFLQIDRAFQLQKIGWDRIRKGERVHPEPLPSPKLGRLGREVVALRRNAEVDAVRHPVTYTLPQLAMYEKQQADALHALRAFQDQIAAAERSGRLITHDEGAQLGKLREVYTKRLAEWSRVQQGLPVAVLSEDGTSATYTAEQLAAYSEAHLNALGKLRAFEARMAAAGHPPTADDDARLQALREDSLEKEDRWTRARDGKPVDQNQRRVGSDSRSAAAPERHPTRPELASQAGQAKEDPATLQPLQMSIPRRLLAPVLSSARRWLHGLGGQWRAMPWTRYLAQPRRLNIVQPADLLRAEHAL
ncbi:MAG: hypothetical protein M1826_006156 [Phylliscum demangeonii]|nr:MAG: hypothetical protein M1826_006156 [Phylliscum demangeonii]